jgi:hypothetical protein
MITRAGERDRDREYRPAEGKMVPIRPGSPATISGGVRLRERRPDCIITGGCIGSGDLDLLLVDLDLECTTVTG